MPDEREQIPNTLQLGVTTAATTTAERDPEPAPPLPRLGDDEALEITRLEAQQRRRERRQRSFGLLTVFSSRGSKVHGASEKVVASDNELSPSPTRG